MLPGVINILGRMPTAASSAYGNVDGPASATDNAIVRFDGTTGKLIQNSVLIVADTTGALSGFTTGAGITLHGGGAITGASGAITLTTPSAAASLNSLTLAATNTATSGTVRGLVITPTYNQASGTAANTDLLINRTETAVGSGTQSLILCQVGGSDRFRVSNGGSVTASGSITVGAGNSFLDASRGGFNMTADGVMLLKNTGGTDFGRLQFGGTTASFPALKRSATALQARLADDSGYAPFAAASYQVNGNAGASGGPFTSISSITVENGIITAITGT